jgi:hypothetical protein
MALMAHLVGKAHFVDKATLGRVNSAIVFGLVGTAVAACAGGAIVFDVVRLLSAW